MKLAIDIGSNTIKCLLGEARGKIVERLYEQSLDSRISAGATLVPNAAEIITKAILFFIAQSKKFSDDFSIEAVATSALRDSKDKEKICESVFALTTIKIRILSGEEEAALSYFGAMSDPCINAKSANAFFDLGGGSMEVVLGRMCKVESSASLPLGAVKMTKRFLQTGNDIDIAYEQISDYAKTLFVANIPQCSKIETLIGVSGAVVAARFMKQKLNLGGDENIITLDNLLQMLAIIKGKSAEEIADKFAISINRAEIIPAAFVCVIALMKFLEKTQLTHTFCNIRYGLILKGN